MLNKIFLQLIGGVISLYLTLVKREFQIRYIEREKTEANIIKFLKIVKKINKIYALFNRMACISLIHKEGDDLIDIESMTPEDISDKLKEEMEDENYYAIRLFF